MNSNGHGLTQKQDRFARFLFDGLSQREAWIKAGYSHNYAVAYVDTHASVLANSAKVKQRFEELKTAADADSIMKYQERQQRLTEFGREDIKNRRGTPVRSGNISAIDTLNKMDRIYTDGATVNVDNRKVEITVVSDKARNLLDEVIEGTGTEKEKE